MGVCEDGEMKEVLPVEFLFISVREAELKRGEESVSDRLPVDKARQSEWPALDSRTGRGVAVSD